MNSNGWTIRQDQRILLLLLGGIGDILLFTPALEALAKEFPGVPIDAVIRNNGGKRVLKYNPHIDQMIIYHRDQSNRKVQQLKLIREIIKRRYKVSITHGVDSHYKTGLLALLSGAKKRIGLSVGRRGIFYNQKVQIPSGLHLMHRNYVLVKQAGVQQPLDEIPRFYLDSEERLFAHQFMEQHHIIPSDFIVGIHPGGGLWRQGRRWPKENFIELINRLKQERRPKIFLLGGPDEKSLLNEIFEETQPGVVFSDNLPTLGEFGALMEQFNLFLSNDSGLLHIAEAMGTPTIALFGPTDYRLFAPIGKQHLALRKDLPCSPCIDINNSQSDACQDLTCLKSISVSEVFDAIMDRVNHPDILRRDPVHR